MYRRLEGRVAIVTGGARGIGAAIAERLGIEGAHVIIFDIDKESGLKREEMLRSRGIDITFIHGDVANEDDVIRCIDLVHRRYGELDILVNNAGIGFSGKSIFEQSLEEWRRIIDVNLTGPYLFSKHAARVMAEKKKGVIVNIASTRAFQSEPNTEPYSASKGGLIALTHALAISLAQYGIRVVAVSPGWIDTSEYQIPPLKLNLTRLDHLQHPARRVGRPEDIASIVAFLVSDEAEWITGVNFVIDGGMTIKMIYLDEAVITDALRLLTDDEEFSSLVLRLIKKGPDKIKAAKEMLYKIIE
ncbi:MAG: SDR family oxidoreductase [Desulfurococcaceae archaeon]